MERYDLAVMGSGPAGQKAAIQAAKLKKRVCIIDKKRMVGGVCLHTGTIPSKTLREAVLYLSGFRQRAFYGRDYTLKDSISVQDLSVRVRAVVGNQIEVVRAQLKRNRVDPITGFARFVDPNTLEIEPDDAEEPAVRITAEHVVVATGTRPASNESIPIDGKCVFDADQLLRLDEIPRNVIVVGAGVIGIEYASMLAAMNTQVTLIDLREDLLDFVDREIIDTLRFSLRRLGTTFRLGEKVTKIEIDDRDRVVAHLESGKRVVGEALLYAVGRTGNTDRIGIETAGLEADNRGRLTVNEHYQTSQPHIYAAGDVIGFPSLASTSMEQGRLASCHMFGLPATTTPDRLPYGIYTIPEISMVGRTEQQLTSDKIPYEVGISKYEELAKGQMIGDQIGM
ncbi:MAG: Si-specific NAD(P)(+) transhydrogenase, partial [Planctomycetes bacterium]|nr:Si-specific NAD(P)(+) transhydrogenase [Planctomycetota bacterium]